MPRLRAALRRGAPRWAGVRPATVVLGLLALAVAVSVTLRVVLRSGRSRPPQVQVLNGSGTVELAQEAAKVLREHGLDVVAVGNADAQEYGETLVLLRRGNPDVARQVRDALGRGTVLEQRDPTLLVDVTVILGRDSARRDER